MPLRGLGEVWGGRFGRLFSGLGDMSGKFLGIGFEIHNLMKISNTVL